MRIKDDGGARERFPLSSFATSPHGSRCRIIRAPRGPDTSKPPTEGGYWEPLFNRRIAKKEALRHLQAVAAVLKLGQGREG